MYANVNVILIVIVFFVIVILLIGKSLTKTVFVIFDHSHQRLLGMQRFTDPAVFLTLLKKKGGVNPMLIKNTDFVKAFSHKIDV